MNWSMNWIDSVVMAAYLIGITLFGIWVGYRRNASSEQYFLANKSLGLVHRRRCRFHLQHFHDSPGRPGGFGS